MFSLPGRGKIRKSNFPSEILSLIFYIPTEIASLIFEEFNHLHDTCPGIHVLKNIKGLFKFYQYCLVSLIQNHLRLMTCQACVWLINKKRKLHTPQMICKQLTYWTVKTTKIFLMEKKIHSYSLNQMYTIMYLLDWDYKDGILDLHRNLVCKRMHSWLLEITLDTSQKISWLNPGGRIHSPLQWTKNTKTYVQYCATCYVP